MNRVFVDTETSGLAPGQIGQLAIITETDTGEVRKMERQMEYSGKPTADIWQRQEWTRRARERKTDLLVILFLTGFAFFINRHMELKGLYMDDLYQWFCYNDVSFFEAVFESGGTRFRVLYNLVSWIQMKLFSTHINWYVPFNILLNTGLAYTLYRIARKFSRSVCVGVSCALIFLASRMSYYQIGQALGLMETMAMWLAIAVLYLLYGYLNEKDGQKLILRATSSWEDS